MPARAGDESDPLRCLSNGSFDLRSGTGQHRDCPGRRQCDKWIRLRRLARVGSDHFRFAVTDLEVEARIALGFSR
ncbi:MAG: hypothetical protein QOJ42_173 [Acidobacteriaceae bacterium]|nr:hypothetical protein [Acidobacteriaceae bacterium]